MKTLVTGGAGFIGSQVVKQLLAKGEAVRVLHLPNERLDNIKGCDVELVAGNVLNVNEVRSAVEGCNKVYHLAAIYAFWMKNPQIMFDVNVKGTENVMQACMDLGVEKVVYTSSVARYAGQGEGKIVTEESDFGLMKTGELYALSKYLSHQVVEDFAKKGLNVTIVCPVLPIGPGDIAPTPTGKYFIGIIKNPVAFYTDTITNAADVRDIAHGHILAMEKGQQGRSYLLGGMKDTHMKEFVDICLQVSGKRKPVIQLPKEAFVALGYLMEMYADFISHEAPMMTSRAAKANVLNLQVDSSRAIKELGYSARPIEESIKDAVRWFKDNRYL
jgi:dihydroflavonol-4-reductase